LPGRAEVDQHGLRAVAHDDVSGLDVAMQDAGLVHGADGIEQLPGEEHGRPDISSATEPGHLACY
jgi:hypothetical protein